MKKKITALLLAATMMFSLAPNVTVFAEGADNVSNTTETTEETVPANYKTNELSSDNITTDITITKPKDVFQGSTDNGLELGFKFSKNIGEDSFKTGDQIEFETNIGTLFSGNWKEDFVDIPINDEQGQTIVTVSITENKFVFTIKEGANNTSEISGTLITENKLTANDVGATAGNNKVETLTVGTAQNQIIFKWKETPPPATTESPVDIDALWKNGWAIDHDTGASISIEVNPIGSMDLYGSTTYPDKSRKPTKHKNFLVKDEIPDYGYVDEESVTIYAAIPTIGVKNEDAVYNGWYTVPAGTYYAVRNGTQRHDIKNRMTKLTQNGGETYEDFEQRIKSTSLSWGIYHSDDKTDTFLCNFGNIGDKTNNNGILYSDFWSGQELVEKYPSIFGKDGATGGNVVSYYIEFHTYYPDIAGEKTVKNYASRTSFENGSSTPKSNGNTAIYKINNGKSTGVVRKNEVSILLLDEDTKEPIQGGKFKIQIKEGADWIDTSLQGETDENGKLTLGVLTNGEYKIIQTDTAQGWSYTNSNYGTSGSDKVGKVTSSGEFKITQTDKFGVGTVVTNSKNKYNVVYSFVSGTRGKGLPDEITDLLPVDSNKYADGSTVTAIQAGGNNSSSI